MTDSKQRTRRIRVEVLAQGALLIGAHDGVHDATGTLVPIRGVQQTYDLNAFEKDGSLAPFSKQATLAGGTVTVPDGGLAEVTVEAGSGLDPDKPPPPVTEEEVRHLRIVFEYGLSNPVSFETFLPRTQQGTLEASVASWAQFFTGATFVVIGRCCDLSSDAYNATLATSRATAVGGWLPGGSTLTRGEQTAPIAPMTTAEDADHAGAEHGRKAANRLIKVEHSDAERAAWGDVSRTRSASQYRRADIYAVGGTYTPPGGADPSDQKAPTDGQEQDPALRRSYVPGDDADAVTLPEPRDPRLAYLVRLKVTWDSPTVDGVGRRDPDRGRVHVRVGDHERADDPGAGRRHVAGAGARAVGAEGPAVDRGLHAEGQLGLRLAQRPDRVLAVDRVVRRPEGPGGGRLRVPRDRARAGAGAAGRDRRGRHRRRGGAAGGDRDRGGRAVGGREGRRGGHPLGGDRAPGAQPRRPDRLPHARAARLHGGGRVRHRGVRPRLAVH